MYRYAAELEPELAKALAELQTAAAKAERAEAAEADMRERTRSLRASNEAIIRNTEKMAVELEALRWGVVQVESSLPVCNVIRL